jgi:hypothetical protein
MNEQAFKDRTKKLALSVIQFVESLTVASIGTLRKRNGTSPANRKSKIKNPK